MAKYPFLSDEWVTEARDIYAQAEASGGAAATGSLAPVRVNLVVTQVPFSASAIDAHVDTSTGRLAIDTGHLPTPDVTVSLDYATARSLFVSGDVQSLMQAFLSGKIKVDGDLSKLLDPKSGIWPVARPPVSPGPAEAGPGGGGQIGGGQIGGGQIGGGQIGLGFASTQAVEVASRLQEITE